MKKKDLVYLKEVFINNKKHLDLVVIIYLLNLQMFVNIKFQIYNKFIEIVNQIIFLKLVLIIY